METLTQVTTPTPLGPGRFALEVQDGWQQGPGAYGGLVLSALARAAEATAATPERTLRTLTGEIFAPVPTGRAELLVEPLRVGGGASTFATRLVQGGEVRAHAVCVLGGPRRLEPALPAFGEGVGLARPNAPPWRAVPPVPDMALAPPFAHHYEYRLTGPAPLAGGAEARTAGWVRPRAPGPARDAAFLVAVADAFWPTLFSVLPAPRPMATITFTIDVVGTCDGLDPDAPLFHDASLLAVRDGYAPELRMLWGEDGRLLTINHQTFVVVR